MAKQPGGPTMVVNREAWVSAVRRKLLDGMAAKGWNQRQLAAAVRVSEPTVTRWLSTGAPSLETLKRIAAVFGVDYRSLAGFEPVHSRPSPIATWSECAPRLHRGLQISGITNAELATEMMISEESVRSIRRGALSPSVDQLSYMLRRAALSADDILGLRASHSDLIVGAIEIIEGALDRLRAAAATTPPTTPDEVAADAAALASEARRNAGKV
jgi:transcriptional regulator with XRE-family HTH domain